MESEQSQSTPGDKNNTASFFLQAQRPWVPVFAQMPDHVITLAQVPAWQFYWDAKILVDTTAEVAMYYDMDRLMPIGDVYDYEIEGMGAKMIYSDNAMPTIDFREPLVKELDDLYNLKTPDFFKDGRLPFALDCIKYGTDYGVYQSRFCSPFSMAVGMRSYPALIKDLRKRPQFAHELFTFIVDKVVIPYLRVQREYCGINVARGADAWACVPNLSVEEMRKWVIPYIHRMMSKAKDFGVTVTSNSGDYNEESLDKFDVEVLHGSFDIEVALQGGPSLFLGMGRWQDYPLEPVRAYTARYRDRGIKVQITVGVNARLLRDGPLDKIVSTVRRFIDVFARDHELTIFLANIPADTPPDHVHAAIAAAHVYGHKPIADDLDAIEFKLPKREPFQQWIRKKSD
jgi:uroporphyrinogen-III decarboxylase